MFRLHLAEEPETVTPDYIAEAIKDCDKMNTDRQWAELEIIPFKGYSACRVRYGTIHSNGMRETAIGTYDYSMRDGKVVVVRSAHV